ncbi:hypothetical protein FD754_019380 [Muntiacus muntjak]|uniref:Methyltransferase domain-containing protein n=1 Tax=Muntiacus muntjak TaxID=9888 RepID=A0A5N3V015_MUNMU|nr:hypothetical protein FD754_019380 [Muntiacus muntjak]
MSLNKFMIFISLFHFSGIFKRNSLIFDISTIQSGLLLTCVYQDEMKDLTKLWYNSGYNSMSSWSILNSPGEGNGNALQYSCLENSMDREAWRATTGMLQSMGLQSQTQLKRLTTTTEKQAVKEFFTKGPGAVCWPAIPKGCLLLFFCSTMTHCSHQQFPYQLLFGDPCIFEDLLALKICMSPDAFFQLSGVNSNTVLLDICCGTDRWQPRVLGIELVEQAVEDAWWTAAFKGITNSEFHPGQAEKILPQLLKSKEDGTICNCGAIHILVFVSCKPHGETARNIIELCCPPNSTKKLLGKTFILRQAMPVDLFPHTLHCELELLFTP